MVFRLTGLKLRGIIDIFKSKIIISIDPLLFSVLLKELNDRKSDSQCQTEPQTALGHVKLSPNVRLGSSCMPFAFHTCSFVAVRQKS